MKWKFLFALPATVLIAPASAELVYIGNGLVNDTVQDLTWMRDTNVAKTLCDANDPIFTGWDGVIERSKETICADDGRMNIFNAESWIARLNSVKYLGHNDWRLPHTPQRDATCSDTYDWEPKYIFDGGYRCKASELGHLMNSKAPAGLGNSNRIDGNCYTTTSTCFKNVVPFINPIEDPNEYWSTFLGEDPWFGWRYNPNSGFQFAAETLSFYYSVWPVRAGVTSPQGPIPGDPETRITLEEPREGARVSGIGNVRGWALAFNGVKRIEYFLDGVKLAFIPYGGTRIDIRDAYQEYPGALNSGFSMSLNYSKMAPGPHTILVRVIDEDDQVAESSHSFFVERFHKSYFPNPTDMDISQAVVRTDGEHIILEGVRMEGLEYNVKQKWSVPAQQYEIVDVERVAE